MKRTCTSFGLMLRVLVLLLMYHAVYAQSFTVSRLQGTSSTSPTSLQFGPDGRLYVSQQNGTIKAYTVVRDAANSYRVTTTEVISLINQIPNHNDDGSLATTVTTRQVTGILVTGTATSPVLYVGSSDSRIGGPDGDFNLDTNSGIISKITRTATGWVKVDLVRGLPRSEENHSVNGLQLDETTHTLYAAIGGHTNAGAPSNNFAFICEYALSACILSIDLNTIEAMPTQGSGNTAYKYDQPTVDDPTRANTVSGTDVNDPFGGNDGLNQAKIVAGGPVQVFSAGYRNAYDLVITKTPGKERRMYVMDNGANKGWGGHPDHEGSDGTVTNKYVTGEPGSLTNGPHDPIVNNLDNLHYIGNLGSYTPGTYYAGHPNPIHANPSGAGLYTHDGTTGVWRSSKTDAANPLPADWPPLPVSMAKPIEGNFQNPGETDNAILTYKASVNGLTEYTASNFNGALKGNLFAAGYNGEIHRIRLTDAGDNVLNQRGTSKLDLDPVFASGFGSTPLDIVAQGDADVFPGTIWVCNYGAHAVNVFEPQGAIACTGGNTTADEDGDGYTNSDELANGTNPCSDASRPADNDNDRVSDLNDADDDNDGLTDNQDFFALDAGNGSQTSLPVKYDLFNNSPGTGFFGLGFTGLMSNGSTDYRQLFDEDKLIAGGAVGAFTIEEATEGDCLGALNNQENAFQFGINVNQGTGAFTVQARQLAPFFSNQTPQNYQSQGMYIGTGDQQNYLKIALNANSGNKGIEVVLENAGAVTSWQYLLGTTPATSLDLYLSVDPATGKVQPNYAKDGGSAIAIGTPIQVSGALLTALQGTPALAVGIIATSRGTTSPFSASWDYIWVTKDAAGATAGTWENVTPSSGLPTARHECGFVEAGGKFYLLGGRGMKPVEIYNPSTKVWTTGAMPPLEMNHFQAVTYNGLIYVIGAFTGAYPHETPVPDIHIYNPATNQWSTGPQIPQSRRRGSTGVVVYNNKFYVVCGITDGHYAGHVAWLDEFDPATNTWTTLPDAPRPRDHFQAAVVGNKLYVASGRRSSYATGQVVSLTIPEVDVFDLSTKTWSTLGANIPTKRAGTAVAVLQGEVVVIGGESGTQTEAHNQAEALNTSSNTWRSLSPLLRGRHGTQAIQYGGNLFIAAGSGNTGGGPELNTMEMYRAAAVANRAPVVSNPIPDQQATAGQGFSFTFAANAFSDPDGNALTYTASLADNSPLPTWLAFNGTTRTFSGTPPGVGVLTIRVKASDGQLTTTDDFTLTINTTPPTGGTTAYLINAGGAAVTTGGRNWAADKLFSGGAVYTNSSATSIDNTTDDVLYRTERYGKTFAYNLPVTAAGTYTVKLHFAEIFFTEPGKRIFSVNLEGGVTELPDFDIFAAAGGTRKAVVRTFDVAVTDGTLNISFTTALNYAKISAIEVSSSGTTPPPPVTTVLQSINAGGAAVTTGGRNWAADKLFSGGAVYTNSAATSIDNTTDDVLYRTERYGKAFGYNIPVPSAATYTVKLHFAEIFYGAPNGGVGGTGKRVFSVNLEGGTVELPNFDIYAEAGGAVKAIIKTFDIPVSDGTLNISFVASVNNAKVSAIEVLSPSGGARLAVYAEVADEPEESLHQLQAYPNPFSEKLTIEFIPAEAGPVNLDLFNEQGSLIRQLFQGAVEAGKRYRFEVAGSGMPRGMYLVRAGTRRGNSYRKVILY